MPNIGDIKKHNKASNGTYTWAACLDCGKERWVRYEGRRPRPQRCVKCASNVPSVRMRISKFMAQRIGAKNPQWKGGKYTNPSGYVEIRIYPDDFFYSMIDKRGYVKEHRLVMARHLGRCLHSWELVHHKNHKRDDNRIENLQLVTDDRHKQITLLELRIKRLETENQALREKLRKINC